MTGHQVEHVDSVESRLDRARRRPPAEYAERVAAELAATRPRDFRSAQTVALLMVLAGLILLAVAALGVVDVGPFGTG